MKRLVSLLFYFFAAYAHGGQPGIWAAIERLEYKLAALRAEMLQLPKPIYYTAGPGIEINGNVIQAKATAATHTHTIGELYHGGIIFYLDESGQHGLIASQKDTGPGIQWRNGVSGNKVTNAKGNALGAGEMNTRLIIAAQTVDDQKGQFAALMASLYQIEEDGLTSCDMMTSPEENVCYGGWYLPSAYELKLLYAALHETGLASFSPAFYWSSTEANVSEAWLINFANGERLVSSKSNTIGQVRPINRF